MDERKKRDGPIQRYIEGDLLLFNRRESPGDMLPTKLSPSYLGPYRVIRQTKNDIECTHIVTHEIRVLHVDRVKPFFGTDEDAYKIGKLDRNQYEIININYFTGNPHIRTSLLFSVTFEGNDTIMLPYTLDLAQSAPFSAYVDSNILLFPLRTTAVVFQRYLVQRNKLPITTLIIGQEVYLHMRFYDERTLSWYDKLGLALRLLLLLGRRVIILQLQQALLYSIHPSHYLHMKLWFL